MRSIRLLCLSVACSMLAACPQLPLECSGVSDCGDGNACTVDVCSAGSCSHAPVATDDQLPCTVDRCDPITGITHTPVVVDDADGCTADACDASGEVTHVRVNVDDGNVCTIDACDSSTGAVTHDAVGFDDQDACTADACDATTGVSHIAVTVDDADACTVDACNSASGAITHLAPDIDDANACTVDACDPTTGAVTHVAAVIDDVNACTTDACNSSSGAITHVAVALDDANACTTDACDTSTGSVSHAAVTVNDFNACTTDACDTGTGSITHDAISIDDNNACTIDSCAPATGVLSHTPINVDDANQCTTDSCDPTTGLAHVAISVDDGIACTTDGCIPASGPTHVPVHSVCEVDGFSCTVAVCSPSTGCSETASAVLCDDSVACTIDGCVGAGGASGTGCAGVRNDLMCNLGQTCGTTGCATGGAQAGRVVITEFRALGADFIELFNATGAPIDVHGFSLRNKADQRATLRDVNDRSLGLGTPVTIAPGAYAWGVANPAGSITGSPAFVFGDPGTPFTVDDAGDQLGLYDLAGQLEDAIDFRELHSNASLPMTATSWPAFTGRSTQLGTAIPTATANDAPSAWCVSFFSATQRRRTDDTAGAANTRCDTFVINEVLVDPASTDDGKAFIELAGPGGAAVGGLKLNDLEGVGAAAGGTNQTEVLIPAGVRMPVDGILLVADESGTTGTTLVPNFVSGVDVIANDADFENGGGDAAQLSVPGNVLDTVGYDGTTAVVSLSTLYETTAALFPPVDASLARSTLSDDTNNNRNDFHADPTPTPGLPNDAVNVTITSTNGGVANAGLDTVVLRGTDFSAGSTVAMGALAATGCTVVNATRMTCSLDSATAVPGAVNVTVTSPASVGVGPVVLTNGFTWTGGLNETDTPEEADYAILQFPSSTTQQSGTSLTVYGRIYEAGVTEAAGASPTIRAELGSGTLSNFQSWIWIPATFNLQVGNDDEYQGTLVVPVVATPTAFFYTVRFSTDGINWTYADLNGTGSNTGLTLEATTQLGVLNATP